MSVSSVHLRLSLVKDTRGRREVRPVRKGGSGIKRRFDVKWHNRRGCFPFSGMR